MLQIAFTSTIVEITSPDRLGFSKINLIKERLKAFDAGKMFMAKKRGFATDNSRYFYKDVNKPYGKGIEFGIAMSPYVAAWIYGNAKDDAALVDIADRIKEETVLVGVKIMEEDEYLFSFPTLDYRPNHIQALERLVKNRFGILEATMASGKTIMIGVVLKALYDKGYKTMLVLTESASDAKEFEKQWKPFDTLYSMITAGTVKVLSKGADDKLTGQYDVVIFDECHKRVSAMKKIVQKLKPRIVYGFTGTVPSDKLKAMSLFEVLGPKTKAGSMREQMDSGVLQKIAVSVYTIHRDESEKREPESYLHERRLMSVDSRRNTAVVKVVKWYYKLKRNILVFCDLIKQSDIISSMLEEDGIPFMVIRGGWTPDDLDEAKATAAKQQGLVIITSWKVFAEAKNIPALDTSIVAGSLKSETTVIQATGRLARIGGHEISEIVELMDNAYRWSPGHTRTRLAYYKKLGLPIEYR